MYYGKTSGRGDAMSARSRAVVPGRARPTQECGADGPPHLRRVSAEPGRASTTGPATRGGGGPSRERPRTEIAYGPHREMCVRFRPRPVRGRSSVRWARGIGGVWPKEPVAIRLSAARCVLNPLPRIAARRAGSPAHRSVRAGPATALNRGDRVRSAAVRRRSDLVAARRWAVRVRSVVSQGWPSPLGRRMLLAGPRPGGKGQLCRR